MFRFRAVVGCVAMEAAGHDRFFLLADGRQKHPYMSIPGHSVHTNTHTKISTNVNANLLPSTFSEVGRGEQAEMTLLLLTG